MCTVYALHGIVAHEHDWMWTPLQHLKCNGTKEQLQHVCDVPTPFCMPCRVASEAVDHLTPHADSSTISAVTSASSQQQSKGVAADAPVTLPVEGAQTKLATQPASTLRDLPVAAKTEDQPNNYDLCVPRSVPVTS